MTTAAGLSVSLVCWMICGNVGARRNTRTAACRFGAGSAGGLGASSAERRRAACSGRVSATRLGATRVRTTDPTRVGAAGSDTFVVTAAAAGFYGQEGPKHARHDTKPQGR